MPRSWRWWKIRLSFVSWKDSVFYYLILSGKAKEAQKPAGKDLEVVGSEKPRINMEVPVLVVSTRGIHNNADSSRLRFHDGTALARHSKRYFGTSNSKHLIPCSWNLSWWSSRSEFTQGKCPDFFINYFSSVNQDRPLPAAVGKPLESWWTVFKKIYTPNKNIHVSKPYKCFCYSLHCGYWLGK